MSTLVCFALKEEAAPFRKMAAGTAAAATAASILITGIGRRNAEKSVREFLATNSPELVLTCGFAGGLNPDLKLGEVIFEIVPRSSRGDEAQTESGEKLEPTHVGCYGKKKFQKQLRRASNPDSARRQNRRSALNLVRRRRREESLYSV